MSDTYETPLFIASEWIERGARGLSGVCDDASGGLLLVFRHGILPDETVKDAARRAVLAYLETPAGKDTAASLVTATGGEPFDWNDAFHEMPAEAWQAAGLTLIGKYGISDAARLAEPVRAGA